MSAFDPKQTFSLIGFRGLIVCRFIHIAIAQPAMI
jgi:hypothetical protein